MNKLNNQSSIKRQSLLPYVGFGFFLSYLLFFIYPIFLNSQVMQFPIYVPAIDPVGIDLQYMLSFSESWFIAKQSPYIIGNIYPPLASVLFTPLLALKPDLAYKLIVTTIILFYTLMTLAFSLSIDKEKKALPIVILIFVTGLFSYGLQFEIERGQSNVISMFICFLAIWIYHYHNKYCYYAYILFAISVQIRVYPLVFLVMFVTDWREWKNNIKRFLLLLLINFAFLFILGPRVFVDFIKAISSQILNTYIWTGNHSINSFLTQISAKASLHGWNWIIEHSGLIQLVLMISVATCLFLIIYQSYKHKLNGLNSFLLLACTLSTMLIPSLSNDYKLSILAAPMAVFFTENKFFVRRGSRLQDMILGVLTIIFSAAYSSTLFSYTNKPPIFQYMFQSIFQHVFNTNEFPASLFESNFPALFLMLLLVTFFSLIFTKNLEDNSSLPVTDNATRLD